MKYSIKITIKRFIEELIITETHIIFYDISSNHTKYDMLTRLSITRFDGMDIDEIYTFFTFDVYLKDIVIFKVCNGICI